MTFRNFDKKHINLDGVSATVNSGFMKLTLNNTEISHAIPRFLNVSCVDGKINLSTDLKKFRPEHKKMIGTFRANALMNIKGLKLGYSVRVKFTGTKADVRFEKRVFVLSKSLIDSYKKYLLNIKQNDKISRIFLDAKIKDKSRVLTTEIFQQLMNDFPILKGAEIIGLGCGSEPIFIANFSDQDIDSFGNSLNEILKSRENLKIIDNALVIKVGLSHAVVCSVPVEITCSIPVSTAKEVVVELKSCIKSVVGQFADKIIKLIRNDYKGGVHIYREDKPKVLKERKKNG